MEISEWKWKSFDGLDMYARSWAPLGKPKAVLLLVHGLGEHVGRFEHVAAALTEKGYALLGADLRGHGNSAGPRGHSPSNEAFLNDLDAISKQADEHYPGIPKFLYGLSFGGQLVLYYLLRRQPAFAGAVVSAPGLRSPVLDQKAKLALGKVLGTILPSETMPSGLDANLLSHDTEVVAHYMSDPLVHDKVSFAMGKNVPALVSFIFEHANKLNIPLLILHGTDDKIVYARGSREFVQKAQKAAEKITLKEWEGMYHEIHNEPGQAQVFAYMIDWLDKHLPN